MERLAHTGDFCPNESCPDHGKRQDGQTQANIIKAGKTKQGVQRYQCKTCQQTFTATKGTLFYRRRVAQREMLAALTQLAEGSRISSVSRTTGHKEDTLLAWLRAAAQQVEAIEALLLADYRVSRGQLDGLWAYVGHKGEKTAIPKPPKQASSGAPP